MHDVHLDFSAVSLDIQHIEEILAVIHHAQRAGVDPRMFCRLIGSKDQLILRSKHIVEYNRLSVREQAVRDLLCGQQGDGFLAVVVHGVLIHKAQESNPNSSFCPDIAAHGRPIGAGQIGNQ